MDNLKRTLDRYAGLEFQSSASETFEFCIFNKRLKSAMQADIKEHFPNLEISAWTKGHFYISGFITRKTDGAIFYFNIEDVRGIDVSNNLILYRSARNFKDCVGGINRYCMAWELLEKINNGRCEFAE